MLSNVNSSNAANPKTWQSYQTNKQIKDLQTALEDLRATIDSFSENFVTDNLEANNAELTHLDNSSINGNNAAFSGTVDTNFLEANVVNADTINADNYNEVNASSVSTGDLIVTNVVDSLNIDDATVQDLTVTRTINTDNVDLKAKTVETTSDVDVGNNLTVENITKSAAIISPYIETKEVVIDDGIVGTDDSGIEFDQVASEATVHGKLKTNDIDANDIEAHGIAANYGHIINATIDSLSTFKVQGAGNIVPENLVASEDDWYGIKIPNYNNAVVMLNGEYTDLDNNTSSWKVTVQKAQKSAVITYSQSSQIIKDISYDNDGNIMIRVPISDRGINYMIYSTEAEDLTIELNAIALEEYTYVPQRLNGITFAGGDNDSTEFYFPGIFKAYLVAIDRVQYDTFEVVTLDVNQLNLPKSYDDSGAVTERETGSPYDYVMADTSLVTRPAKTVQLGFSEDSKRPYTLQNKSTNEITTIDGYEYSNDNVEYFDNNTYKKYKFRMPAFEPKSDSPFGKDVWIAPNVILLNNGVLHPNIIATFTVEYEGAAPTWQDMVDEFGIEGQYTVYKAKNSYQDFWFRGTTISGVFTITTIIPDITKCAFTPAGSTIINGVEYECGKIDFILTTAAAAQNFFDNYTVDIINYFDESGTSITPSASTHLAYWDISNYTLADAEEYRSVNPTKIYINDVSHYSVWKEPQHTVQSQTGKVLVDEGAVASYTGVAKDSNNNDVYPITNLGDNTEVYGSITIDNDASITNDITVGGDATITGDVTAENVTANDTVSAPIIQATAQLMSDNDTVLKGTVSIEDENDNSVASFDRNGIAFYPDIAAGNISLDSGASVTAGHTYIDATGVYIPNDTDTGSDNIDTKYVHNSVIGQPDGIVPLNASGRIDSQYLTIDAMEYKGTWDASTNTPTLANGTGTDGDFYICEVAGTVDFGSGNIEFRVNDRVIYNGSEWQKLKAGNVDTVNSQTPDASGNVEVDATMIHMDATDPTSQTVAQAILGLGIPMWTGTLAQYNAVSPKDPDTLYFIVG